jgi:hypothetical protein
VTASGRVPAEFFSELIALERTRLALLEGDLVAAELALPDWQKRIAKGAATMREYLLLARFVVAAGGDPSQLLEEMPKDCEVTLPHRIQIGLLKSLAAIGNRDDDRALEELAVAMRWATVSGHRQRFLDERSTLGAVLDNAAAHAGMLLPASDDGQLVLDGHPDRVGRGPQLPNGSKRREPTAASTASTTPMVRAQTSTLKSADLQLPCSPMWNRQRSRRPVFGMAASDPRSSANSNAG